MNLIDKKELLNERPEMLNPNMNDEIKSAYNKGWNACNSEWINLIEELTTAYDVERVIKQLESEASHCASFFDDYYTDDYERGKFEAYNEAVEIVKKGGEQE